MNSQPTAVSKWTTAFIVMIGIFIGLLDTTIVEIVLPKMMASLDTDTYGIQWAIISYLLGAAIAMTSVSWIGSVIGHRYTYLAGIIVFTVFSAICGQVTEMTSMTVARFFQGVGEGIIVPIGMTMICDAFPDEERGMALGIFGLGASFAPALGPTIGGYITEHLTWRWIFYINIPMGLLAVILTIFVLRETGSAKEKPRRFDLPGFLTMSVAFGSLITFLSEGQEKGWLQSDYILLLVATFFISMPLFLIIELKSKEPLFDLRIFCDRNFSLSMVSMFLFSLCLYGVFFLMPMYLVKFKQFTTLTAGLTMLPGAFMAGIGVFAGGFMADKYNPKRLFIVSSILMVIATYYLGTLNLDSERSLIIILYIFWNLPMAFNFPPIQAIGLNSLPKEKLNLGSCGQNVSRLLAGSVGTAITVVILERRADAFFESLGMSINYGNIAAMNALRQLSAFLYYRGTPQLIIERKALKIMELYTTAKAYSYAFQSALHWMAIFVFVAILCGLFIRSAKKNNGEHHVPLH